MNATISVSQAAENSMASLKERHSALWTGAAVVMFAVLALPFGGRYVGAMNSFLPAIDGASFVAMLVSAAILRNQYLSTRFVPHAFLSVAFGGTALMILPYTIAFPGAFSPTGFGFGPRVAAWLWVGWHAAFVLSVGAYVWSESYYTRKTISEAIAIARVRAYVTIVSVVALVFIVCVFRFGNAWPVLINKNGYAPIFHALVLELLLTSCACVFVALVARTFLRRSTDLWIGVVMVAFAVDLLVGGEFVRAPFTIAWYLSFGTNLAWQTIFLVVQLRTASERLAAYAHDRNALLEETRRDALTGLLNRREFNAHFEEALMECRLGNVPVALLALDLDHFKAYNNHYGHLMGDDALRAMGGTFLQIANRPSDACFRVGGEEFAILLTGTDTAGALVVAERLRAAVMRLRIAHAPTIDEANLTVSIGICAIDGGRTVSSHDVFGSADRALYRAKALGRNRIVTYFEAPPVHGHTALRAV